MPHLYSRPYIKICLLPLILAVSLLVLPFTSLSASDSPPTAPSPIPGSGTGSISGHVYEADGKTPITGVQMAAIPAASGQLTVYTHTDSDGAYHLANLAPGDYKVSTSKSGYITEYYKEKHNYSDADKVQVTAGENSSGIDMFLDVGGIITGYIFQADGITPLSGVKVYTLCTDQEMHSLGSGISTANGSYFIRGLPSGQYQVYASIKGYIREYFDGKHCADTFTPVNVTAPETISTINFKLDRGGAISGHVYEADGVTPIEKAWVVCSGLDIDFGYSLSARTADDGSYIITGLPSGKFKVYAEKVSVEKITYISEYYNDVSDQAGATPVEVVAPNITQGIDFTLNKKGSISGRITSSSDGAPIPGVEVTARMNGDQPYPLRTARSQADGSYIIEGLVDGSYSVSAIAPGYLKEYYDCITEDSDESKAKARLVSVAINADTPGINFVLKKGGSISGRVFTLDGKTPLEGAGVYASSDPSDHRLYSSGSAKSGADGSYTISGLPSGKYQVHAGKSGLVKEYYKGDYTGHSPSTIVVTAPETTPNIDFFLGTYGSISGRITRSSDGAPVAGAEVMTENWHGKPVYSRSDGSYVIEGLEPGNYRVSAVAPGYIRSNNYEIIYRDIFVNVSANTPNVDFALEKGGSISGRVFKSDRNTLLAGMPITVQLKGRSYHKDTVSGPDGSYTIANLPAGDYLVFTRFSSGQVEYYGGALNERLAKTIHVTELEETSSVDFALADGGSISGRLTYSSGRPADRAFILAECSGVSSGSVRPYADGTYIITGLRPGQYKVVVESTNGRKVYTAKSSSIALVEVTSNGNTQNIDIDLGPQGYGTFSGKIYVEDGVTAMPTAWIQAFPLDFSGEAPVIDVQVGVNGTYQFPTGILQVGRYALQVFPQNTDYMPEFYGGTFDLATATAVEIKVNTDTPGIEFVLEKGGSISGRVFKKDGVTPIQGAVVRCYKAEPFQDMKLSVSTNSVGYYYFKGLIAGDYIISVAAPDGTSYLAEQYYKAVPSADYHSAVPLNVSPPGEIKDINFAIDPNQNSVSPTPSEINLNYIPPGPPWGDIILASGLGILALGIATAVIIHRTKHKKE
jgi:hypothetical protein